MQNAQLYAANVIGGSGDGGDDEFVDAANAVSFVARSFVDKRRSHFVIILCARDWTEMQYAPYRGHLDTTSAFFLKYVTLLVS